MGEALLSRWHRLHAEARQHKAAIRRHREQLAAVMAEATNVERECRRLGIALVEVPASTPAPMERAS